MVGERQLHVEPRTLTGPVSPDLSVPLNCPACGTLAALHPEVTGFYCRACDGDNLFCECSHCGTGAVVSLRHGQPLSRWKCPACERRNAAPLFGRLPTLTAHEVQASTERRDRLGHTEPSVTVTDLEVLASTDAGLPVATRCSVTVFEQGITIHRLDAAGELTLLFADIGHVEVAGRDPRPSGRTPLTPVQRGATLATAPSAQDDAVVRLTVGAHRFVLAHPTLTRAELTARLATMLTRWDTVRQGGHRLTPRSRRPALLIGRRGPTGAAA